MARKPTVYWMPLNASQRVPLNGFGTASLLLPATFTNAAWTAATRTLVSASDFTNYQDVAGSKIRITDGTGITAGIYEIESKTDNDTIVLTESIGADATDVDGHINGGEGVGIAYNASAVRLHGMMSTGTQALANTVTVRAVRYDVPGDAAIHENGAGPVTIGSSRLTNVSTGFVMTFPGGGVRIPFKTLQTLTGTQTAVGGFSASIDADAATLFFSLENDPFR